MKKVILYIFIMLIMLWSGASFASQDLTRYSAYTNLQNSSMKSIAAKDYKTLMGLKKENGSGADVENITVYELNDENDEILTLKYRLYYLDYLSAQPDNNILDTEASNAVKKYQTDKGLELSGVFDKITYDSLLSEGITYVKGKTGEEIRAYQLILFYNGYLDVYPSGYFGTVTVKAVKAYQKDKDVTASGKLDISTQELLDAETYNFKKGDKNDVIFQMQKILVSKGYLKDTSDGKFDDATAQAVEQFQQDNNLQVSGEMDKETIDALSLIK